MLYVITVAKHGGNKNIWHDVGSFRKVTSVYVFFILFYYMPSICQKKKKKRNKWVCKIGVTKYKYNFTHTENIAYKKK